MESGFVQKYHGRVRFRLKVPKALWDYLPKIIAKEITGEYQDGITGKCRRCGERLKELFARAVKGMVNREILCELAEQICNEELYRLTPTQSLLDLPKNLPSNPALLQSFFGKILESLHIKPDLPQPLPILQR